MLMLFLVSAGAAIAGFLLADKVIVPLLPAATTDAIRSMVRIGIAAGSAAVVFGLLARTAGGKAGSAATVAAA